MDLTDKMLMQFYFHIMQCLRLWTNNDKALIQYYIETEMKELFQLLVCKICNFNDDGTLSPIDPESVEIEYYETSTGDAHFIYSFDYDDQHLIDQKDYYSSLGNYFMDLISDELLDELYKYADHPENDKFVLEVNYRLHTAIIMIVLLYNLRNKLNHITVKDCDNSELFASSIFCSTILKDLINGIKAIDYDHLYVLRDVKGHDRMLFIDVFVDKSGEICLTNCKLD